MSPGYEQYTRDEPILSNLMCSGNETYLYQCPYFSLDHNVTDSCSGFAAVLCYDDIRKLDNVEIKKFISEYFLIHHLKYIECSKESSHRDDSFEYPKHMFG